VSHPNPVSHPLARLLSRRAAGEAVGITAVCSAHETVLRAALARGRDTATLVLIEATCNQVNQDGGYTGLTPAGFAGFVRRLAEDVGFDPAALVLGGDHMGPNPWRHLGQGAAMAKAETMVAAYAGAGFSKIHLDASMGCAGEPEALDDAETATRAVRLARAAEAGAEAAGLPPPIYVIGTEVPPPGGARHALEGVAPTSPQAARDTIQAFERAFAKAGLDEAFTRVAALVVQPGVEFGHDSVVAYEPSRASGLSKMLAERPGLVFEAHSTDYQPARCLAGLVRDGFAILKVGPGLTFAMREALYGLDLIAGELDPAYPGRGLADAMEAAMLAQPAFWQPYYPGDSRQQHVLRHYSYSDRIRYYWPAEQARAAVARLFAALDGIAIPPTLRSQFLPRLAQAEGGQAAASAAQQLVVAAIDDVLTTYAAACAGEGPGRASNQARGQDLGGPERERDLGGLEPEGGT
jgi:D-tagatose-bisphosphate aldolase class II non-catalytic subunit